MGISTTESDGLVDYLRFGIMLLLGLAMGICILLEALLIVSPDGSFGEVCGRNNNLLGLDHLLPPISAPTRFLLWLAIDAFCFLLVFFLLRKEKERLRLLVQRSNRICFSLTGRVSAWVFVLSAVLFLINNTSTCSGVLAVSCLSTCLVGAVNLVADPEDGIAVSRWVLEQSIVVAFIVIAREGGGPSSYNIRAALFPIVPALWALIVHKIDELIATKEWRLPISIFDGEENSDEYEPIPDLDSDEMNESAYAGLCPVCSDGAPCV